MDVFNKLSKSNNEPGFFIYEPAMFSHSGQFSLVLCNSPSMIFKEAVGIDSYSENAHHNKKKKTIYNHLFHPLL